MAEPDKSDLPETGDPEVQRMEERWLKFWEEKGVYHFDRTSDRPIYAIDTPPPTVSGKMHIGHAYSYNQMDFVARYKRMRGYNLFYPFGFDDNGLPTERLTEREVGARLADVGREKFIKKCLAVTKKFEASMEESWRRIGTSCDWNLVYRTIDPHARKTSQASFVDLFNEGRAYRAERPTISCPECATAIAQVEIEDKNFPSEFVDVSFDLVDGEVAPERGSEPTGEAHPSASPGGVKHGAHLVHREEKDGKEHIHYHQGAEGRIVISTTRPELIPACVGIVVHPNDPRTAHLQGKRVKVPVTGQEVPVVESDKVDKETGTGVVMCCTFGDQTDIDWWQEHNLDLRVAFTPQGRVTEIGGPLQDKTIEEARQAIKDLLATEERLLHKKPIEHAVGVHERCGTPIEFLVTKQWFVSYLDLKDKFLDLGNQVNWHPDYMKVRYDNWVKGLKWDWCISRQRYFGVPFPVWYCGKCDHAVVPPREKLPVDPITDPAPVAKCPQCGDNEFNPENDVMDTWATSSLTPQIALNWVENDPLFDRAFPMSLRPQAHEIISFWAFNTIVKAWFHNGKIPWSDIMISGFVKLGKGKKMSKSKGNIVEPLDVISRVSGDALRYWSATGANLGEDIIWNPKDLTRAQRLVTKLRNVQTFIHKAVGDDRPERPPDLPLVDRWILHEYSETMKRVTHAWETFEYTRGIKEVENFLWHTLADHYLELVKHRLYRQEPDAAVRYTLYTVGLGVIKALAPVLCFVTEDLYQEAYRKADGAKSVHVSAWPEPVLEDPDAGEQGEVVKEVTAAVRAWKGENKLPLNSEIPPLEVVAEGVARKALEAGKADVLGTTKAADVEFVSMDQVKMTPVAVEPVFAKIGPKYRAQGKEIVEAVKAMNPAEAREKGVEVQLKDGATVRLEPDEYEIKMRPTLHGKEVDEVQVGKVTLLLQRPE